jgi:hypothetical protein
MNDQIEWELFCVEFEKLGYQWSDSNKAKAFLGWRMARAAIQALAPVPAVPDERDNRHASGETWARAQGWNECVRYMRKGYERYETARRMNPQQWSAAWELNLKTGKPFDEIIDDMRPFMVPNAQANLPATRAPKE